MFKGLKDWEYRIKYAAKHFRHLWHWSDSEIDKLEFYRLNEILMEAKETYPDHFGLKQENG